MQVPTVAVWPECPVSFQYPGLTNGGVPVHTHSNVFIPQGGHGGIGGSGQGSGHINSSHVGGSQGGGGVGLGRLGRLLLGTGTLMASQGPKLSVSPPSTQIPTAKCKCPTLGSTFPTYDDPDTMSPTCRLVDSR